MWCGRMNKRFVKRALELIGAVAVVYLMLELLESHTMDGSDMTRNIRVRLPQPNGEMEEVAVPAGELKKLQEQILQVKQQQLEQQQQQQQQKQQQQQPQQQQQHQQQPQQQKQQQPRPQQQQPPIKQQQKVAPPAPQVAKVKIEAKLAKPQEKSSSDNQAPDVGDSGPVMNDAVKSAIASKKSLDLGVNTDFKTMNIPQPSLKSSGYVLPMLYFDMGPNNLFRLFRQSCVTAYEMGRKAVIPVFHRHPRMGDSAANPFVLPIFDTNYTVDLVWPPAETVDPGFLKKAIGVSSMREFRRECNGKLDAVVKCGDVDQKRLDGLNHFQRAADMKVVKEIAIKSYEELVPNDLSAGIVGPNEYKCLGIIYGKKCLPDQNRWLATFSRIARSFMRPPTVRRFAESFIKKVMGNKPYLAVHWRYESDWLDMCKPSRPKGSRERNKEICKIVMGLTYDDDIRANFVQALKDKMADYSLEILFLASPPNNIDLIRLLKDSFRGNFFYSDDVTKYAEQTEGKDFITNNYKYSFVEQEICFKSTFYLGAALSSWTQTVLTDRLARGIKRHDSVLNVVGRGAPGYPQLVFQFPEGDFNFGGMIGKKKKN